MNNPDLLLSGYRFDLPEERIAQQPAPNREASRLMVVDRRESGQTTGLFTDILDHLPENCLLVANNSRVVPARLFGERPNGGKAEMLLLTPVPLLQVAPAGAACPFPGRCCAEAEVLLRPAKKIRPGDIVRFSEALAALVLERGEFGRFRVRLFWDGELAGLLQTLGSLPLPPYIRREAPDSAGASPELRALDAERYQTTYARADKAGSVAAPTAGLHFTPELRERLLAAGHEWAEVTLYVGYGTFSPVRCDNIVEHEMHAEYVELPESTAQAVARAKREGRAVVPVGTTSCRVLEGVFATCAAQAEEPADFTLPSYAGWINIFLYPGKTLHVADGLITNFHLPESSLLMLVSAFAGRERILAAYKEAVERKFRFFSYGDAMLIR